MTSGLQSVARHAVRTLCSIVLLGATTMVRAQDHPIILRDVTIIDVSSRDPASARKEHRSVLIQDGVIVRIGKADLPVPAHARIVDGSGKFLIPGLWEMHAHLPADAPAARRALAMQLANGIVAMRDMGNELPLAALQTLIAETEKQAIAAPQVIASPLRATNGREPGALPSSTDDGRDFAIETKDEARELVATVRRMGLGFIKPYDSIPAPAYAAMMREAARLGLPASGHVPRDVPVPTAIALGQVTLEHAQSLTWACAPAADARRRAYYLESAKHRFESNLAYPDFTGFTNDVVDRYDAGACAALLATMARRRVHYTPTLVTRRFDVLAGFREYRTDPLLAYIDADTQKSWNKDADRYAALPAGTRIALHRFLLHAMRITGEAYRAGVPILVGSDSPDSYIFPGFSYHLEMEMLAEAGLPPLAILQAATLSAARFMKMDSRRGTIAEGRVADLVLLDADPLADIGNIRRIRAVMRAGRLFDRAALDALLASAQADVVDRQTARQAGEPAPGG